MLINLYFKEFLEEKNGFRKMKWNEMKWNEIKWNDCFLKPYVPWFSVCKYLLLPIFRRNVNIFRCLVFLYYAILTYFFKKILKNSTFIVFQPNLEDVFWIWWRTFYFGVVSFLFNKIMSWTSLEVFFYT